MSAPDASVVSVVGTVNELLTLPKYLFIICSVSQITYSKKTLLIISEVIIINKKQLWLILTFHMQAQGQCSVPILWSTRPSSIEFDISLVW